jgi:hypothetical protein
MFFTMEETLEAGPPVNCLVVYPHDPANAHRALHDGQPAIACHCAGERLILAVDAMAAGDVAVVAERLRTLLRAEPAGGAPAEPAWKQPR